MYLGILREHFLKKDQGHQMMLFSVFLFRKNICCGYSFVNAIQMDLPTTMFICVEILRPSQLTGFMLSAVSLPNHTFTGQA